MIKKIINRKDKGGIGIAIVSLFMLMLLELYIMIPALYQIGVEQAQDIQDDLHLSNLAVYKDVDMNTLAKATVKESSQGIYVDDLKIGDPNTALNTFKDYLETNMNLNSNFYPKNSGIIVGQVAIQEFTIYNVDKDSNIVTVERYNDNTHMFTTDVEQYKSGESYLVKTSNNKAVEDTCVSSAISFETKTIFGNTAQQHVSVDTDITK